MLKNCRIAFSAPNPSSKYEIFFLKKDIQTFPLACNSVIISAAAYFVKEFPNLPHPHFLKENFPHDHKNLNYSQAYLSLHPLLDEWIQIFGDALVKKNACRNDHTLCLKIEINEEYATFLKEFGWQFQTYNEDLNVWDMFGVNRPQNIKKLGWISCSCSRLKGLKCQPIINTISILLGEIYSNQELDVYHVLKGQIPSVEQLMSYDSIIIPGSGISALLGIPEIQQLSENILQAYMKSSKLKIMGICFGHQLVAKTMGALLEKRNRVAGLEVVRFFKDIIGQFKFLEPLHTLQDLNLHLSELHQDYVITIPQGFLKFAHSNSSEIQGFVSEDGRIFTTQFHPQYNYLYTKGYSSRIKAFNNGIVKDKLTYAYDPQIIEKHLKHCEYLRQCISNFI